MRWIAMLVLLLSCIPVAAEVICVSNINELRNALNVAAGNGEDDEVRLASGYYPIPFNQTALNYTQQAAENLTISAGWSSGC